MTVTVSSNSVISTLSGITQTDESHATVADSIVFSGTAQLTLDKSLFCQQLLVSSVSNTLIAGANNVDGSFREAEILYINPASPDNSNFSSSPPLDLSGYFTLTNVDLVAGSNVGTSDQTTFIGQYPTPSIALTGGANRIFKNVRIRTKNRNNVGIHFFVPHCTIDGLTCDFIDFVFVEVNPVSTRNFIVTNSTWGIGHFDKGNTITLSSSVFSRVFIQRNSGTGNELSLVDVAVLERYMMRSANDPPDNFTYRLKSTFKITGGTANAKFSLLDKDNNVLLTQTADGSGNTTRSSGIEYATFTKASLGLNPIQAVNTDPDNTSNYVTSANITSWMNSNTAKFSFLLLPLKVIHYGYSFLPNGETITTIDTSKSANSLGFSYSPKLFTDTNVTLSESSAQALSTVSTLDNLYDVAKVWNTTAANTWYPSIGAQAITAVGSTLDLGSKSLTVNSSAGSVFTVNTSTNLLTVKTATSNLLRGSKFGTLKTSGTVTLEGTANTFYFDMQPGGTVVVNGNTNLQGSTFINTTINRVSGSRTVIVDKTELGNVTAGTGVTVVAQSAITVSWTGPTQAYVSIQVGGVEVNNSGLTTSPYTYNYQYSGNPTVSIKVIRQGWSRFSTSFVPSANTQSISAALSPNQTVYTGSTNSALTFTVDPSDAAHKIRIGNAQISVQTIYDRVEDQAVANPLLNNLQVFPTLTINGSYLTLNTSTQLIRNTSGDVNAAVLGAVFRADGSGPIDGTNGNVTLLGPQGLTQQNVRDAMALALTVGTTVNAGSIDSYTSGGSGVSDWTSTERNQIRKRLGIDGTTATPSATPDLVLSSQLPTNFNSLAITVGGAVTVGTNSDKTGYSLSSSQSFNLTGNITGNLSGSVGSVTSAITLPNIPANWITASGINSGAITSAKFATDAIDANAIAASAVTEIQSGLATSSAVSAIPTNPLLTTDSRLNNLDATISSRSTLTAANVWAVATSELTGVGTIGKLIKDNLDATVSSRSTYGGGDTSGTTTLLSRLTSGRATNLDNLDAAISTRSTYNGGDTPGTTTLLSRLSSTRAGYLDNLSGGAVMLAASYAAPDNTSILAIKAKTDQLGFTSGNVNAIALAGSISVSSIAANGITAASLSAGAIAAITSGLDGSTKLTEIYKLRGLAAGVSATVKDAEPGVPGSLVTSDGISQTLTKNGDGSVTITRN